MDSNENIIEEGNILPTRAIVLPLLERPLFPETFTTLLVGRPQDVQTMTKVIEGDGYFAAILQDQTSGYKTIGTLAKVSRYIRLPNNCIHVFISTLQRVKIEHIDIDGQLTWADFIPDPDTSQETEKETASYVRVLRDTITSLSQTTNMFSFATDVNVSNITDASLLSFYAASAINAPGTFLEEILETHSAKERIEKLLSFIAAEKDIIDKENEIKQEIYNKMRNRNREQLLREQIKALNGELQQITGQSAPGIDNTGDDLWTRAKNKKLPDVYRKQVDKELEKLSGLESMNPEYAMTKLYIETILSLPFSFEEKAPDWSITKVKKVLEHDHYGMKEVKQRILEFLASRLKAGNGKGAIICLSGPPGVGKTSIGYSIARALGKKIFRFSVGGMRDEAEIKGHRRTYVGAMPGKIIQAMKTVGVSDPVILIDEIDKMGESYHGDPGSALLEVLDPEQNTSFQDFYIDLPYDLSNVLFIVTANDPSRIPEPLLDRMEIIDLSGYTPEEKIHIGHDYLVPRLLKKNGLSKSEIRFDAKALSMIAEEYAREAGVRNYEKSIDKIMRKIALEILEKKEDLKLPVYVKGKNVEKYLGKPIFPADDIIKADKPGTAIGLAWTSMGGDVLLIEAEALPMKGEMKVTGQLGSVMQESVSIAWSSLKKEAYLRGLDLDFFDEEAVHIHIPEGATPKDGPSAGITLFSALWSMYRDELIKPQLAMTGELTLTGHVMPIGGLKEKILAARRNGIKEIIIPERNKTDLDKLDKEVKGDVVFHTVSDISEVIAIAFPEESSKRLSKSILKTLQDERKKKAEAEKEKETLKQAAAFEKAMRWE
ncbi:MAG: endopeptidase La [Spirochaetes bacterium]|uniref:Lon protease n=1 Tax=Candidatus Ornithospirochaeta stercoripullorum TaxID=2840899 RepID=A0A9D9DYW3_9SPIO|nr:endopeptidase La [Candidatus Ornithospirochaeta stercoripullorum]